MPENEPASEDFAPTHEERVAVVRANLKRIRDAIDNEHPQQPVRIVAITKYIPPEWCHAILDSGITELGENRVQAGIAKFEQLRTEGRSFTAHMVGTIQSNKARRILGVFEWVQSLDSVRVARRLHARAEEIGITLQVLIEANMDEEPQKSGLAPDKVMPFAAELTAFPRLVLRGLMCIPRAPGSEGVTLVYEQQTRGTFARSRELFKRLQEVAGGQAGTQVDTLSMGMSLDYPWAVAEGANMVRIGRALYLPPGDKLPEQQ